MTVPGGTSDHRRSTVSVDRRTVLTGVASASVGLAAGCTTLIDSLAEQALGDVNLFNEVATALVGGIAVVDPGGETVLSERFELAAQTGDEPTEGATRVYEDVWTTAGDYDVTVELDEGYEVRGESRRKEPVTIDYPADEMLGIPFGAEDVTAGIHFAVADTWSAFHTDE